MPSLPSRIFDDNNNNNNNTHNDNADTTHKVYAENEIYVQGNR